MILHHAKGSCSLGILVLIEELGIDCEIRHVDLPGGEQRTPEFLAINPKGKVPALIRDDGQVITEWPAIASYLAALKPERQLLPADPLGVARVLEAVEYVVSTMHMQGFSRIVRPENFCPERDQAEQVKERGLEIFRSGFDLFDRVLEDRPFVAGSFSIADAALFYAEWWMVNRLDGRLPRNCNAHYERLIDRAAVRRALDR